MRVSSDEVLTEELIRIIGAKNIRELKNAIQNNSLFWISVFRVLVHCDFHHLKEVKHKHSNSTYRFVTLKFALEMMQNFDYGSKAYGSHTNQLAKYKKMLSSLSFLDSDLYASFLLKRFKYSVIQEFIGELDGNNTNND